MCRLYGFRASEPTKVECSLVHAQNALLVQSRQDLAGFSHAHGWGIATYNGRHPHIERQAWAAYDGEHFRQAAARSHASTVLAHVRRATVGPPTLENTHPFEHGPWAFMHNGTLPRFERVRDRLLDAMTWEHRAAIGGVTDSEHMFHFLLSLHAREPSRPVVETVRDGLRQVLGWCREVDPAAKVGLNVMLTDGFQLIGTRWGRTLYRVEHEGVQRCAICGEPHAREADAARPYRAVALASEPITDEPWIEVPEGSIYTVTPELTWRVGPLL